MYTRFVRFVKRGYRLFHRRWKLDFPRQGNSPVVYVSHHQNMRGPIHAAGLLPGEAHIWAYHPFLARGDCYRHFYHYTFRQRFGWPTPVAAVVAWLASLVVPPLLRGLGSIPVYRDKRVFSTLQLSVQVLEKGENLLIFPDKDYTSKEEEMGELQTGFLALERLYHRKTGRHLAFVPLLCQSSGRVMRAASPIYFRDGQDFKEESRRVSRLLQGALNTHVSGPAEEQTGSPLAENTGRAASPEP